ncbi:MAG: hypothetical protein AB8F78_09105 [Saprospiraceae bacterium]
MDTATTTGLPTGVIVADGDMTYIYVNENTSAIDEVKFTAIPVKTKEERDGMRSVELLAPLPANAQIVAANAYYVYAQGIVGELEHVH